MHEHISYVQGYGGNKYIAAQGTLVLFHIILECKVNIFAGPTKKTVTHFWRMVWEYNIPVIVMLTQCVEMGKVSCIIMLYMHETYIHTLQHIYI